MAVMTVEVPDKIANGFSPFTVVKIETLFNHYEKKGDICNELKEIDGSGWNNISVKEDINEVRSFLKSINK